MAAICPAFHGARVFADGAPDPHHTHSVSLAARREAEVTETPFEILIQKGIQNGIEAAVGVAECHAEEVGAHDSCGLGNFRGQGFDQDEDMNGRPADDKYGHHHQDETSDAAQIAVLLP